jgi:hypothetical protein
MSASEFHGFAPTSPLGASARPAADRGPADRLGGVLVKRHLNGPRRSANGGFAAGAIARHIDADVITVVLRRPIRLGRTLDVLGRADGAASVHDRGRLVAEAYPGRLVDEPAPPAPTYEDAVLARSRHPLLGVRHPLDHCVVCGPRRSDGMHVTPGPIPGHPDRLAAPWIVDGRYAHAGIADYPAVWGALDCTSYPARALEARVLCLLGTMTARIERSPRVGERLVVHSWTREHHGRRHETSIEIVDERGGRVARADATWIEVKHPGAAAILGWFG